MSSSIGRADEVRANTSNRRRYKVDSLPALCSLSFREVTSTSVAIDLKDISSPAVKSFNIWCSQENEDIFSKAPASSFLMHRPREISISNLQPGTRYRFRAVAYGDVGEVGCSDAFCSTKSLDEPVPGPSEVDRQLPDLNEGAGPVLDLNEGAGPVLDLNEGADPVLDLNKDTDPVPECNRDEGNGCALAGAVRARDDEANDQAEVPLTAEAVDANSTVVDRLPMACIGDCVRMVRLLERNGHVTNEFRQKFLSWFALRSTEEDKEAVSLFIETLRDDEKSLAEQLVDTFSDKISNKRLRR